MRCFRLMVMWWGAKHLLRILVFTGLFLGACGRGSSVAPQTPDVESTELLATGTAATAVPTRVKTPVVVTATHSPISPTSTEPVQPSPTPVFTRLEPISLQNITRIELLSKLKPRRSSETLELEFNPSGDTVAIASADGDLILWRMIRQNGHLALSEIHRHGIGLSGRITALNFHPDGMHIALARSEAGVDIWDIDTGAVSRQIPGSMSTEEVMYLRDGSMLAVAGQYFDFDTEIWKRKIEIWDVSTMELSLVLDEHPHGDFFCSLAVADEQTVLAAGYCNYNMMTWDLTNNFEPQERVLGLYSWQCPSHCPPPINRVLFRPGTTMVVSGTDNPDVPMRDITSGRLEAVYTTARSIEVDAEAGSGVTTYAPEVSDLAFSPDGSLLVLTAWNDLQLRDADNGELLYLYEFEPEEFPTRLAFSRDGLLIAVGTSVGNLYLFGVPVDG